MILGFPFEFDFGGMLFHYDSGAKLVHMLLNAYYLCIHASTFAFFLESGKVLYLASVPLNGVSIVSGNVPMCGCNLCFH